MGLIVSVTEEDLTLLERELQRLLDSDRINRTNQYKIASTVLTTLGIKWSQVIDPTTGKQTVEVLRVPVPATFRGLVYPHALGNLSIKAESGPSRSLGR